MDFLDFVPYQKIARLSRDIVITEKIDGTNAQVAIFDSRDVSNIQDWTAQLEHYCLASYIDGEDNYTLYMLAGSRNRWLTRDDDNFGFAKFVQENCEELFKLGKGRHYGEWWGQGIQRGYDLKEKKFSLFNVKRWMFNERPACCDVVPIMYEGPFDQHAINTCISDLADSGSRAAPGFMKPEGVVIFHKHSGTLYKKTIENDSLHKGEVA